jgi:hypothetical protein
VIRAGTADGWRLVTHREHAWLAGEIARHWKNDAFLPPDPFVHVLDAVSQHDGSWADRDSDPELGDDGRPSAFSRELVGEYEAFENVDLDDYLRVRAEATEAAADRDPYAAVLIAMHTVNLLDEQADPSALDPSERDRRYALEPWPFDEGELVLSIPYRHVRGERFDSVEAFRERYRAVAVEPVDVQVIPA